MKKRAKKAKREPRNPYGIPPMPAEEYAGAMAKLGASHSDMEGLTGKSPRTSRKYKSGDLDVPRDVAVLLRLMIRHKIGLPPKKGG